MHKNRAQEYCMHLISANLYCNTISVLDTKLTSASADKQNPKTKIPIPLNPHFTKWEEFDTKSLVM
jgi:hypothetical protein